MLETVAFYMALLDIKRPVSIKVFFNGYLFNDNYDAIAKFKKNISLLNHSSEILKNRIFFKFIFQNENSKFSKKEIAKGNLEAKSFWKAVKPEMFTRILDFSAREGLAI